MHIQSIFPTYQDLEAAAVPAVAGALLAYLWGNSRNGESGFHRANEISAVRQIYDRRWEAGRAASEGLSWLEARGLICTEPGSSDVGRFILTREGIRAAKVRGFETWMADRDLPEALLHPFIVRECMTNFRLGKYDTAVFEAFKTLEVEIRSAGGFSAGDIGVSLVRKAFNVNDGPLTDPSTEAGERQSLSDLMAGALGSYKNPHSHRKQTLGAAEAREMLIIASHLLGIVHTRRPAPPVSSHSAAE